MRLKTTSIFSIINNFINKEGLLIVVLFLSIQVFAQCPTVVITNQTFCDIQSPTIANLQAINNGGGVSWFATATSTTPLSPSAGLVNGEDYFADNSTGNCGTRTAVVVTIYGQPFGQNFQGVCVDNASDATLANLIAIGNDVKWYNTPVGGTPLPLSTVLTPNTIYYASQTNPNTGCETSRLSVFVSVGLVPIPSGSTVQTFCNNPLNPPTIANLNVSGNNNWYATISSALPLPLNMPLVDGQSYFATTVDPPCESTDRLEVVVSIQQPNNAGHTRCQHGGRRSGPVDRRALPRDRNHGDDGDAVAGGELLDVVGDGVHVGVPGGQPGATPAIAVGHGARLAQLVPDPVRVGDVLRIEDVVVAGPVVDGEGDRCAGRRVVAHGVSAMIEWRATSCNAVPKNRRPACETAVRTPFVATGRAVPRHDGPARHLPRPAQHLAGRSSPARRRRDRRVRRSRAGAGVRAGRSRVRRRTHRPGAGRARRRGLRRP